ncbi:hypothetical protein G352_10267 [Rhodococcus ruber BKS 20-38]|uniref:Uncharacterized protein n=1 Tax=Rhodococcus ruber BKS 20-38 TaxID=1278076 RepID=M2ZXA2_9NOCA|nr:hypothetical protein [Rhodococcus ruber]EME65363.1 hypothetical protein G352_10267 [Rhodococcus ruber BKS 20-38]
MTTTRDRLAARLDDEFDYDPAVRETVLDELAALCKAKKVSAAKLKDSVIISAIEDALSQLPEDDAPEACEECGCAPCRCDEPSTGVCDNPEVEHPGHPCNHYTDDAPTMTDEINAASLEGLREARAGEDVEEILDMLHTAPAFDVEAHNAAVAERDAKEAAKAAKAARTKARRDEAKGDAPKRPAGSHAECDHPRTKAGRAACRRERAKAAAAAQES